MALDTSNTGRLTKLSQDLPVGATRHFFNGTDDDSDTAKEIVTAPGVGRRLILTHLTLGTLSAQAISILDGASTILIGPIQLTAAGVSYLKEYKWGIELTENTAMYVESNADAVYQIYVEYINAPV